MRKVPVDFRDKHYEVMVRDDEAAYVHDRDTGEYVTSIWPFHSERVDDDTISQTVREMLSQLEPVTSTNRPLAPGG
jgi:hypothetical protein